MWRKAGESARVWKKNTDGVGLETCDTQENNFEETDEKNEKKKKKKKKKKKRINEEAPSLLFFLKVGEITPCEYETPSVCMVLRPYDGFCWNWILIAW